MKFSIRLQKASLVVAIIFSLMATPINPLLALDVEANADPKAASAPTAAASMAVPADDRPTGDVSIAAMSRYFWRGYELSRNSAVIQPSITVAYKGFSANLWGNLDTKPYFQGATDPNYAGTWNETDYTLSYSRPLGMLNVGGGYIYYALGALNKDGPKRADAQELFATASLNTLLLPTMTVYKEIGPYQN